MRLSTHTAADGARGSRRQLQPRQPQVQLPAGRQRQGQDGGEQVPGHTTQQQAASSSLLQCC